MTPQNDNFIDELLAKTDLVQLVGEYVQLSQKGGTHWGCCPFHNEKTPSFTVHGAKQLYYCFGSCREGGNAITFIKKIENIDGGDAVKLLAKRVGLEVPQQRNFNKETTAISSDKKERLYKLMKEAALHYHNNLVKSKEGAKALSYLTGRGIDNKLIKKFGLGYSIDGTNLVNYLIGLGYTVDEMKLANMAQVNEKGAYDPFQYRLMVPIISQLGEVAAFGGRSLLASPDFAKYRNSTNNVLFEKNKVVFAANLLQKLKKDKAKIDYVILCEGYMDVIALHNHGFNTAVASMGTALTFNQAKQIRNFVTRVYISFDGDAAGQKNTLTGLDILVSAGLSVRVVELPPGYDPDDVVSKNGAQAYQKLLDTAISLPEFKIKTLQKRYDVNDFEGKSNFAKEAVAVIVRLENPVERERYFQKVQKLTGYSLETLHNQADRQEHGETEVYVVPKIIATPKDKISIAQEFVLASMAAKRGSKNASICYVDFSENFDFIMTDDLSRKMAHHFVANFKENTENSQIFYENLELEEREYFNRIINYQFKESVGEEYYKSCIIALKENTYQKQLDIIKEQTKQAKNSAEIIELAQQSKEINDLRKLLRHNENI